MVRKLFRRPEDAQKLARSARSHRDNVVKASATTRGAGYDDQGRSRTVAHAMWGKVMGRSPKVDEAMTSQDRAQALVDKHGGNKSAAAREAGMHRRSFERALNGANVKSRNAEKLARAERRVSTKKAADRLAGSMTGIPRTQENRDDNGTLGLWVKIAFSGVSENRWIYPGGRPENEGKLDDIRELIEREGFDGFNDRWQEILSSYLPDHNEVEVEEVMDIQW